MGENEIFNDSHLSGARARSPKADTLCDLLRAPAKRPQDCTGLMRYAPDDR
jgi:hypothetical protein